jgi:hypothetical protein
MELPLNSKFGNECGAPVTGIDVIGDKVVEINTESPRDAERRKALRHRRLPNRHRSPGAPHLLEVLSHSADGVRSESNSYRPSD